ncbi:MAG: acetate/propionate family kinase [Bacilli bacterium]
MKILTVNAGSSSLKFTFFNMENEEIITNGVFEKIGFEEGLYKFEVNGEKIKGTTKFTDHSVAFKFLLEKLIELKTIKSYEEIDACGHRVVHGGNKYADSIIINDAVLSTIENLIPLAPLHNPANLTGIKALMKLLPNINHIAVFDTAFHQTIEKSRFLYPLPYSWFENLEVRKYGFHGTSHKFIANRVFELENKNLKIINCHIGNGASLCAIKNGKSVDTTMGFTPNAGLIMGSRCGDIDSGIIPYVMNKLNLNIDEINNILNKESGILGISEVSSDARDIEDGMASGNEKCALAYHMQLEKIVDFISSYYVLLGGADVITFTAGLGENAIDFRREIIEKLQPLGIKIDKEKNNVRGKETLISTNDSKVKVYVIPTNEELVIARDTLNLIKQL